MRVIAAAAALCGLLVLTSCCCSGVEAQQLKGNVSAVYDLLERVIPGSSAHFTLSFTNNTACNGICFQIWDTTDGRVGISGTSASELSAGAGWYLRDVCNMTIGWPRGGGSNVFTPKVWPQVGASSASPIVRRRAVPWSYMMNVCTHSYSLVWYSWDQWTAFIDWAALSGINLVLAMTGQEEVQYKVFQKFGLDDETIRTWFNGPAFLTWSRGQNEYGNNIAGPLPRSWMQAQWGLQRQILARYRSLGIVGQLPGFQGNVPWELSQIFKDANITKQGDTGWMYSTDPLFAEIADAWMQTLIADFGTDHWYQLDGYFNGGTAPWYSGTRKQQQASAAGQASPSAVAPQNERKEKLTPTTKTAPGAYPPTQNPDCTWSQAVPNTYLAGCENGCETFPTLAAAQAACAADYSCGGLTLSEGGLPQLRSGSQPLPSPSNETSYYITNVNECHLQNPYPDWVERGTAAYMGLNRTDPEAIWSFQGWAIIDWQSQEQALSFRGFVDAVPQGKFVVIDMSEDGSGEWQKWDYASFFGAPFIWTTLHDFGGTDAMKGDLSHINQIPFAGMAPNFNSTVWGTGFTPEGIDQNPVYYEFIIGQNFRTAPVSDIVAHTVERAHRRYGLTTFAQPIADAWALLVNSTYAQDLSVQDGTGIPHLPGSSSQFESDRVTPTPRLCLTFNAWKKLLSAASLLPTTDLETYRYDLVNLGREVLAQLSTPMSMNFSDAMKAYTLNAAQLQQTGNLYIQLLADVDTLVATDSAFLLGPWIESARYWGQNFTDCGNMSCADFMEWNARCQLTTWNPTPAGATQIPGGPIDYASKHWSGLIDDYYKVRAQLLLNLALKDAAAGKPFDQTDADEGLAHHAYSWQTATNPYPTEVVGDYLEVSQAMLSKYASYFSSC